MMELRREVRHFAEAMEQKLRDNDHKSGWKDCKLSYLWRRVGEEMMEFEDAVLDGEKCLGEAADVANYLMMICDVEGCLE